MTENSEATAAYLALKESTGVALSDTATWFKLVGGIKGDKGDPGKVNDTPTGRSPCQRPVGLQTNRPKICTGRRWRREDITALVEEDKTALDLYADLATRRLLREQDVLEIWLENQDGTVLCLRGGSTAARRMWLFR